MSVLLTGFIEGLDSQEPCSSALFAERLVGQRVVGSSDEEVVQGFPKVRPSD